MRDARKPRKGGNLPKIIRRVSPENGIPYDARYFGRDFFRPYRGLVGWGAILPRLAPWATIFPALRGLANR